LISADVVFNDFHQKNYTEHFYITWNLLQMDLTI